MIPFRQYLMPDGRQKETGIERPKEVEELAKKFIEAGGRYECEVLSNGFISLTAFYDEDDIAIEVCENNKEVLESVDKLVKDSLLELEKITKPSGQEP